MSRNARNRAGAGFPVLISDAKLRTLSDIRCRFVRICPHLSAFSANLVLIGVIKGADPLMIQRRVTPFFRRSNVGATPYIFRVPEGVIREIPERYPGDPRAEPLRGFAPSAAERPREGGTNRGGVKSRKIPADFRGRIGQFTPLPATILRRLAVCPQLLKIFQRLFFRKKWEAEPVTGAFSPLMCPFHTPI